jgi:hypothetical protein
MLQDLSWIDLWALCEEVNRECYSWLMLKCGMVNYVYTTETADFSQFLLVFVWWRVVLSNRIVVLNTIMLEDNSTGMCDSLKVTLLECLTAFLHFVSFICLSHMFRHFCFITNIACICYSRYHTFGSLWISLSVVFLNIVVLCQCLSVFFRMNFKIKCYSWFIK